MYVTLFDKVAERSPLLGRLPKWGMLRPSTRSALAGVSIVGMTLVLGSIAAFTSYGYSPLVALGLFYGIVISKLLSQFLAPKIQTLVTGFIGGITTGSIGSQGAKFEGAIAALGKSIDSLAAKIHLPTGGNPNLSDAVVWCFWIAIVTTLLILAWNAYYANVESSKIGTQVPNPSHNPGHHRAGHHNHRP